MKNIIDYVKNEMSGFETKKFKAVDSLVLSQFSYLYFERLVPGFSNGSSPVRIGDLLKAEHFGTMFNGVLFYENNLNLLYALAASPRFRDIKMNYYVDKLDYNDITRNRDQRFRTGPESLKLEAEDIPPYESITSTRHLRCGENLSPRYKQEKQFSAVTYQIDDQTSYVSYRGTDMTFVGWKEDFNMAFQSPVPSQEEGVEYLNSVGELLGGNIIVGGHSKGGNIAVYSAMMCDPAIQNRILDVYSHDGPGFKDSIFHSPEYMRIRDRIHKILPQSSIVGMLLQTQESYKVIKSRRSGIMQHDPFTWVIENDDFHYVESISNSSLNMNKTINEWLSNISDEKRELFIDALFQTINSTNAKSIGDLSEVHIKDFAVILKAFRSIDNETRRFLSQTVRDLIVLYVKNLNPLNKQN